MPRNKQPNVKPLPLPEVIVESGARVKVGSDLLVNSGDEDQPYVATVNGVYADKKDNAKLAVTWYYFPEDVERGRQPYHAKNEVFKSNHHDEISSKSIIWTCTVLSLEKWIGFLGTEANPDGPRSSGPVGGVKFDIRAELSACRNEGKGTAKKDKEGDRPSNAADDGDDANLEDEIEDEIDDKANAVYMCRHQYDAVRSQWKDVEVPVFCVCNLPYNPDLDMVQCNKCNEWYHPECLKISDATMEQIGQGFKWTCPNDICGAEGVVADRS